MSTNTFMVMFSVRDLIILGIILVVILLVILLGKLLSSKKRKKQVELAEEEADFYCDLYYNQMMKVAEAKYKAYVAKGYQDKLPNPIEAIGKDKQMQELLDETDDLAERRAILEEYLPNITLALARCKAEGMEGIPKKEATQLKKLMREYYIEQ